MADQTNLLSFSTRVDLSGAKAGMAELKDTISSQMAEAADAVSAAGVEMASSFETTAAASTTAGEAMSQAYADMEAQGLETMAALTAATTEASAATIESASESAAAVADSVDIQQAAYAQLAQATLENSVAQQLLKGAYAQVKDGTMDASVAIEALAGFEEIAAEASAALAGAKANLAEVTEYLNAATSVEMTTTEASTAVQNQFAASVERSAVAQGHSVSEVQAASGAIRVFEGALPIRAVERFAVTSLGLGPILQAMFPIVGAIAFGEVIYESFEKAEKAIDGVEQAGARATAAWAAENNSLILANDSLDLTNDKLDNTLAKLEHKPENGLQVALDEDIKSADELSNTLQKAIDKSNELITKNQVGLLGQIMGKAGTSDSAKMVTDINAQIAAVKNSYQDTIDQAGDSGASNDNIVQIKTAELTRLEVVYSSAEARIKPILHQMQQDMDMYRESNGGRGQDTSGNIAILQGYLNQLREEQKAIGSSFREDMTRNQIAPLQAEGGGDAAAEQMRAIESAFAEQSRIKSSVTGHGLTAGEGASFWSQYLTTFQAGSEQYKKVLDEVTKYTDENHKQMAEATAKSNKSVDTTEALRGMQELQAEMVKASSNITRTGSAWNDYYADVAKASEIQASVAENVEKANLAVSEQVGTTTRLGAAHVTAGIHADEYRLKLQALEEQLRRLQAEAKTNPITGQNTDPKNAAQQVQVQNSITQTKGQQQVAGVQDTAASAQAMSQPYLNAFDSINSGFLQVQSKMIMGTQSISRDFANMGAQLVNTGAAWAEKWLAKQASTYIADHFLHQASEAAKAAETAASVATQTATQAAASATTTATTSAANVAQAMSYAGVAAAGAAASVAATPIVGPALAPAAAAATFADTAAYAALAAFDTGGIIANTGVALVHKDEAVLPAPLTNLLMSTAGQGGGNTNTSSSSLTQNNHFSGATDAQFRNQMMRNSKTAMKSVHRQARSMGRA